MGHQIRSAPLYQDIQELVKNVSTYYIYGRILSLIGGCGQKQPVSRLSNKWLQESARALVIRRRAHGYERPFSHERIRLEKQSWQKYRAKSSRRAARLLGDAMRDVGQAGSCTMVCE